jgi:hypothetical protein
MAYPHIQMRIRTGNRRTLAQTYSLSGSQSFSSNTKLQDRLFLLDCHRTHCSSPLLFQTAAENNVTIIRLPNHCTHTLQLLDKFFLTLKSYFENEAAGY